MYTERKLTTVLTYLGALPFFLAAFANALGLAGSWAESLFLAYGGVILSFMAGTTWMQAQALDVKPKILLPLSNAAALLAFVTLVAPPPLLLALLAQALAFLVLLVCDYLVSQRGGQPLWYLVMRRNVSIAVLTAYAIMLLSL